MAKAQIAPIEIQIAVARRGVPHARKLRTWVMAAMPATKSAICIRIVGNAESRKLNRQWRSKDKPTNVLSFSYSSPSAYSLAPSSYFLGDLALCAPVIAREAREQGKTLSAHWAHMVVHGVLHLHGYDHVSTRDAKQMEACERKILAQLGYSDPYQGGL